MKVKNKRNSGLADHVNSKKKSEAKSKKLNPFEVHINREKIKVLGKKSKHDKGLPGVSRAKAIQKRHKTLGIEMRLMPKSNTFIDRRIGEKSEKLSAEDRMVARFAAERAKQHSRKNIYNLADNEILTHRGQTLEQIEKFDDPRSDDEDQDDREFNNLDSDTHFGGGVLAKGDSRDGAKSHKDIIEQLIAESKKRKAEKQKEKDQTIDLTEKLDSEWKELRPLVFKRPKVEEDSKIDQLLNKADQKGEDYDKMMRELRFEKRGVPTDGLKSLEKQEEEAKKQLEQWEKERQQRMVTEGIEGLQKPTIKHVSAENLDENFALDDDPVTMVAYDKDGKLLMLGDKSTESNVEAKPSESSDQDSSSDDETSDVDSKSNPDEESGLFKKGSGTNSSSEESSSAEEESDEDSADEPNEKTVFDDGLLDPSLDENSEEDEPYNDKVSSKAMTNNHKSTNGISDSKISIIPKAATSNKISESLSTITNKTKVEVPEKDLILIKSFFNEINSVGDKLQELLTGKSEAQQIACLEKLIKSYDPSLAEANKELLSCLYAQMLQYINDTFLNATNENSLSKAFETFNIFVPFFYDISKINKVSTKQYLIEVLKEKRDEFLKNPKRMPDIDTLIFFKLVSLLYPTSDFSHPVTTPALIFMSEILGSAKITDAYSVSRGLFLTALVIEYTVLSKRIVPPAHNFLLGLIYLAANTSVVTAIQVVPPFKLHKMEKILKLEQDCSKMEVKDKLAADDLLLKSVDDSFKIRCLSTATAMTKELFDNFNDIEAQKCMFESHIKMLGFVDLDNYPEKVRKAVNTTLKNMQDYLEVKTFTPLCKEVKAPRALRLYEPDIQEVFTGSKSSKLSREKAESARLQTKYKKEMKGALREIRRDKAYIASVKLKQKIQSDNIRKGKVKQIFKDASIQQGELNKL